MTVQYRYLCRCDSGWHADVPTRPTVGRCHIRRHIELPTIDPISSQYRSIVFVLRTIVLRRQSYTSPISGVVLSYHRRDTYCASEARCRKNVYRLQ